MRGSESYYWNIMQLDGGYCHVDILRDLLGGGTLRLRYDEPPDLWSFVNHFYRLSILTHVHVIHIGR